MGKEKWGKASVSRLVGLGFAVAQGGQQAEEGL